jgi:hypothetical protein
MKVLPLSLEKGIYYLKFSGNAAFPIEKLIVE